MDLNPEAGPNISVPGGGDSSVAQWSSRMPLSLSVSIHLHTQTEDMREGWASSSGGNGLCRPPTLRFLCVKLAERM